MIALQSRALLFVYNALRESSARTCREISLELGLDPGIVENLLNRLRRLGIAAREETRALPDYYEWRRVVSMKTGFSLTAVIPDTHGIH